MTTFKHGNRLIWDNKYTNTELLCNSIHELPIADLYRWSWGRWRVSESVLDCKAKC